MSAAVELVKSHAARGPLRKQYRRAEHQRRSIRPLDVTRSTATGLAKVHEAHVEDILDERHVALMTVVNHQPSIRSDRSSRMR